MNALFFTDIKTIMGLVCEETGFNFELIKTPTTEDDCIVYTNLTNVFVYQTKSHTGLYRIKYTVEWCTFIPETHNIIWGHYATSAQAMRPTERNYRRWSLKGTVDHIVRLYDQF